MLYTTVSENASESASPTHAFNCNIASNNHEGNPWYIYLGPLLTAFRASIVSDPDIWQKHPPVRYKALGDATFIASEFLDRNEFDALDRELFILYIKLTKKNLINSKNEGKVSQLNKAVNIIRRDSIACHSYALHKYWQISVCSMSSHFKTITICMTTCLTILPV